MKKLHSSERMSKIVVHNKTVYLCGQVGNAEDDIKAQTLTCLEKIESLLQEVGSDRSKLLMATVWVKSMSDFAAMNEIYAQFFDTNKPARATVQAARLPRDARVEIDCIAVI